MAFECQWPCVSDSYPSTALVRSTPAMQAAPAQTLSFAAALAGSAVSDDVPFPTPCIKGDALSIKIGQEEYHKGLDDCKKALRARLTLNKGDKPYAARDLSAKIGKIWKTTANWKMVPLGKGYYDFHFDSAEDLKKIWAAGTVNLKPGLLRFSQWTKDFKFQAQKQTHVSLWIRLVELPQEYWRERTLKEIASAVGTPIDIDGPTRNRTFGHYARILVDVDLSKKIYDEVLVERDDFAFMVEIQYERLPLFCRHCYSIGHNITTCRWLKPQEAQERLNRGKQPVKEVSAAPPKAPQFKDRGASTSTGAWIPVNSTVVTTTQVVPVPQIPQASLVPVSIASESIPVPAVPLKDLSTSSFSLPLHNVFDRIDRIETEELDVTRPVLEEVVSPDEHVDVQPVDAGKYQQTSREVLENPKVSAVTNTHLDDVGHNHASHREVLVDSDVSIERITHSSPLGREGVRPDGVEQTTQTSRGDLENPTVNDVSEPLQDGVELDYVSPRELEESPKGAREIFPRPPSVEHVSMREVSDDFQDHQANSARPSVDNLDGFLKDTIEVLAGTNAQVQEEAVLQRQEVHPSKNIQDGMDLWARVREYDARSAAEAEAAASKGIKQVLTRNQKQKIKVQSVIPKQSSKSRARGENQKSVQ
jgi:hypothetical protein